MLCLQTLWLIHEPANEVYFLLLIFFATLLSYNTHFWLAARKSKASRQLIWFSKTKPLTVAMNAILLALVCWLLWQMQHLMLPLLIAVVLNAAYTAPLLLNAPLRLPLLFTFVKSYFIGFAWAFVTVVLPVWHTNSVFDTNVLLLLAQRFMLVSLATLIFDCRDRQLDQQWGVHTPANCFSPPQMNRFFLLNLLLYGGLLVAQALLTQESHPLLQLLLLPLIWTLYQKSISATLALPPRWPIQTDHLRSSAPPMFPLEICKRIRLALSSKIFTLET